LIYKKESLSDEYYLTMLKEAVNRNLNCKDIAKEILDFKDRINGSNNSPGSSSEASSNEPSESINWVTGRGRD
jgi:hypothetical protein